MNVVEDLVLNKVVSMVLFIIRILEIFVKKTTCNMKTFASAVMLASAMAEFLAFEPKYTFTAVEKSPSSRYELIATYGVNGVGHWGDYAFIYMELRGAPFPADAVISTWATLFNPNTASTETVECTMRFDQ